MPTRLPLFDFSKTHRTVVPRGIPGLALVTCGLLTLTIGLQAFAPGTSTSADAANAAKPASTSAPRSATIDTSGLQQAMKPLAVAAPAVASGPVTGGTVVTVSGAELTAVSAVQVGGVPAAVVDATPTSLSYQVPVATELSTGTVAVELFDVTGAVVPVAAESSIEAAAIAPVVVPKAAVPESELLRAVLFSVGAPGASDDAAAAASGQESSAALLSFEYLPDPRVTAQTDYVLRHWSSYNPEYNAIYGNDCVNFTSQGLIARGWQMDAEWNYNGGAGSAAWISSTAFYNYMAAHPERGSYLDDSQRASVKVGDIAQFDWDGSGDRDHTATVTRIDKTDNGVVIYVAGHSKDSDYWNVDEAIGYGGAVSYWSLS